MPKPNGRPPLYKTAEDLEKKIAEYFDGGMAMKKVVVGPFNNRKIELMPFPTISGLVLYCGFSDRHSFYDLEKKEQFTHTIKRARSRMEQVYEEHLLSGLGAGAIFALKNLGWKDTQEIEHRGIESKIIIINGKNADTPSRIPEEISL